MPLLNHTKTFMLLAAMTALFGAIGYLVGGIPGMAIAFVIAVGLNVFSYWNSDSIVLKSYRAKPAADFQNNPKVSAYLQDTRALAQRAGLPEPKIYIVEMDQPNAFATGRNPDNAAVVATTGLLNMLNRDEIAGVMAHELAHIKNRDTLTMTVTATIAGAIGLLANFALFFGGRERGGLIAGLAIAFLAPIAASIVQMAISRAREYEADKGGAEILGNPEPLARALAKISGKAELMPDRTTEANQSMAHMFIVNPLAGQRGDNLFSTHPATQNRIEALMTLQGSMDTSSPKTQPTSGETFTSPWLAARQSRRKGPWG